MKKISLILAILLLLSLSSCAKADENEITDTANTEKEAVTTEAQTEPPVDNSVTLYMVGDVLLHERVSESGKQADGTYNYDHFFAHVRDDIEAADVAIVNQEVILGGLSMGLSGYPAFNGAFEVGDAEVNAGFDIILHATNHAMDKGKSGILNCMGFWKTEHPDIKILGINETQSEQDTVYIREVKGMKIAFLNYTYGLNGISLPEDMPYIVNLLDENKIKSDLAYAEANADFTVVCPHWGTEYIHTTDSNQEYWTDIFVSGGADLIIGTHPHVVEPVEKIGSCPVYYSIGNFINSTAETGAGVADRMLGAAADVTLDIDEDGKVYVKDYGVIPLVCNVGDGEDMTVYRLSDYTEELAQSNAIVASDSSFSLSYMQNLSREIFGDLAE